MLLEIDHVTGDNESVRLYDAETCETILELNKDELYKLVDNEDIDLTDLDDSVIDYAVSIGLIEEILDNEDEDEDEDEDEENQS